MRERENESMTTVLKAQDVTVSFAGRTVLRNAQIQADSDDVVALLGPNGAGKTTLLKAVLGLVKRSGSVELTRDVGILLDEGGLLPGLTGRQHVHSMALSHNLGAKQVTEILQLTQMEYAADQKIKHYSLGMKRRIALAAALIGEPDLLLLDEPANGLDPEGIRWLTTFLKNYAQRGHAVVVSTHHLAEAAAMSNKVTMIRTGQTIFQGPTTDDLEDHYFDTMGEAQ